MVGLVLDENLKKGEKKKKGKIVNMLSNHLLIRHKPTKIEYTIKKVIINGKEPIIVAYSDFKQYEPV